MQFFQVLATFTLLSLSTHKCLVNSNSAPGDNKAGGNRFNTHLSAVDSGGQPPTASNHPRYQHIPPHQQQQPHHQQHHGQHQYAGHGGGGGHNMVGSGIHHPSHGAVIGSPHIYHPAPNSGHAEHKNTYNLLSEAMSQAVSNEFSSLGSGSADGACHADDLDCYNDQDRLGMEAIRSLHRQLDDDDNGNIDLSESDDFLREELKYDSGYEKRQKAFHFNDDMHISVKELWEAWLRSEVHNWTTEQTTDWLAQSVQLPQYVDLFKQHKVSGASLPRLAVNNMHYVSNVLGIKDPIHKQKIALKAMDVVLFGPPRETGTRWKDYILVTLLLSAIIGCWYAYQQNKNAKRHLRRMAQDMEGLQRAEQSLQEMQKELERARLEQENVATEKMDLERRLKEVPTLTSSNSDLEVQQLKKEIEMLRTELSRAEIELVDNCWAPPPQLQSWLQYTYELESKNHLKKRVSAEKQLQSAREACEKLRKKRSSLVGAFVSTHGKSIDDVDRSIVEARNSLGEVTNELQERLHRWKQIEQCLGMNIVNNNGLPYLESVLYGRNGGGGSGSSVKSSRARITSSSDDLDDESVQEIFYILPGLIDGYSRNSGLSASTLLNSSSTMGRDDSSGSEDNIESQSVQFYLGNAPPTPMLTAAPAVTPRTPLQQAPSFEVMNHVGNHNHTNSATAAAIASAAAATGQLQQQQQQQQHACNNDSVIHDLNRHSPSVSSERSDRSIPVPPRTKKHAHTNSISSTISSATTTTTTHSVTSVPPPPPPSGPIGRAPLPPPRKSNQSPLLRSQSSDLMAAKDLYNYLGRPQPLQPFNKNIQATNGAGSAAVSNNTKTKQMVKQHSTASQQSTSSTSSSVQSTGDQTSKQQSPSRLSTTSLERQIMTQHHQYHHQQQQQQHSHHPLTSSLLLDKDLLLTSSVTTLQSIGQLKTDSSLTDSNLSTESYHSDTQLNVSDKSNTENSAGTNSSSTLKKRKKGLRFGFGSKKSSSNSSAHDTSTKSK
ncbi:stromal interaction molecule homolog isoform X1 [Lucilia cuprina]|uniref:stromal interaction molecule homolog isoform X1 n=1 Tax=Lucilia cuprina TaxID=7375 RepID=UPI001F06CD05|nr:stromal interaction molecule homolog isoform X1 [Lucilia cuprina]XP_046801816.1 stromal interaction molecule homolog isoform X1 [Lucilia cuprina]